MTLTPTKAPESRLVRAAHRSQDFEGTHSPPASAEPPKSRHLNEARLVCLTVGVLYAAVAWALDFKYHVYPPDAVSRMANGFYVLYSRHPHLAAIGFVWNPLQSICDMVPLLAWNIWPAVARHDVAGSLVSVVCMTGAVHQLRAGLAEAGVQRPARLVLTALFALNPMILYYSGNGMSEALYLFTALATCRYLWRWFTRRDLRSLVYSAVALGLCYLARNEAVAIALTAGILVVLTTFRRTEGNRNQRVGLALTDLTIFLMPFVATFVGWAFASYVITGQPFQQFTSQYGNSSELALFGGQYGNQSGHDIARLGHEVTALGYMAPLLPVALILALLMARRRRDAQVLVPAAVLGGGLGFIMISYLENQVFPWYRFYILSIPLEVMLVGAMLAIRSAAQATPALVLCPPNEHVGQIDPATRRRLRPRLAGMLGVVVALVIVTPSVPATAAGMFNTKLGIEESFQLGFLIRQKGAETAQQRAAAVPMLPYVDHLNLPDGSVVTDEDLHGCATAMIIRSTNPKVFVIPNDVDFKQILADPFAFHVPYILVPQPAGFDLVNAVVKAYPTLYTNGDGFARLVRSFPASTGLCPPYRLYKVFAHAPGF
jgi:hypothetical protein